MRIFEIAEIMEEYAPLSLAEDYDNVGLIIGDGTREVSRVLLTLDVDMAVAREAVRLGAELIISHHPMLFNPVKKITADNPEGNCLLYLIENGIAVYSAHTNLDSASGGLCDLMAALLEIENVTPLDYSDSGEGIGRIGWLREPVSLEDLATKVKDVFSSSCIRFSGNPHRAVSNIALCSGGGGSMVNEAIRSGAEVYITGDVKYSSAREAVAHGMDIIEVGHFDSEIISTQLFKKILADKLGNKLELYITTENNNVISNIV